MKEKRVSNYILIYIVRGPKRHIFMDGWITVSAVQVVKLDHFYPLVSRDTNDSVFKEKNS